LIFMGGGFDVMRPWRTGRRRAIGLLARQDCHRTT
jgi:hypothetical protein